MPAPVSHHNAPQCPAPPCPFAQDLADIKARQEELHQALWGDQKVISENVGVVALLREQGKVLKSIQENRQAVKRGWYDVLVPAASVGVGAALLSLWQRFWTGHN